MTYHEDQLLPLSGIQHFYFCRRQWALIHVERQWIENVHTLEGRLVHNRTDNPFLKGKKFGVVVARAMPVVSYQLGLFGVCDVIEFRQSDDGVKLQGLDGKFMPYPIEYKKGGTKSDQRDEVQLCAQAICLEEMLSIEIIQASFYYAQSHRREEILLSSELRQMVQKISLEMHDYYDRKHTPKVKPKKGCNACSLNEVCLPDLVGKKLTVKQYISNHISED